MAAPSVLAQTRSASRFIDDEHKGTRERGKNNARFCKSSDIGRCQRLFEFH